MRSVRWINPREDDKTLHVETPLGIVNIIVGLTDHEGRRVDAIQIIPNRYAGEPFVMVDGGNTRLVELLDPEPLNLAHLREVHHLPVGEDEPEPMRVELARRHAADHAITNATHRHTELIMSGGRGPAAMKRPLTPDDGGL